jgi:hypothetical protein
MPVVRRGRGRRFEIRDTRYGMPFVRLRAGNLSFFMLDLCVVMIVSEMRVGRELDSDREGQTRMYRDMLLHPPSHDHKPLPQKTPFRVLFP